MNTARENQKKMQDKAGKYHALCMCETCDEDTTNSQKWEGDYGLSNKEKVPGVIDVIQVPPKG